MISNLITLFRTLLILPFFVLLVGQGTGWTPLALFLLIGALDIVDGKVARHLGESSRLGAMLDLLGDRFLTLAAVSALVISGLESILVSGALILLVARDLAFATLSGALPAGAEFRPSKLELPKIVLSFLGLGFLIAPAFAMLPEWTSHDAGGLVVMGAAVLAIGTIANYGFQLRNTLVH